MATIHASTYHTELGSNVFYWRDAPLDSTQLPGMVIRDTNNAHDLQANGNQNQYDYQILSVEIECTGTENTTTPEYVDKMIADVQKAIGVDDTWGGIALRTELENDEKTVNQDSNKIGGALIKFNVRYRTNLYAES